MIMNGVIKSGLRKILTNDPMSQLLLLVFLLLSSAYALYANRDNGNIQYGRTVVTEPGYPSETHHVVTKDGYILELHRIPYGKDSGSKSRPIVFLMHGFLGASNSYTFLGSEYGMAYNLADAGFDVWMGNARGNTFSRKHVSLDPDKDKMKFFDFSFEEIALDDLPTMFDYILKQTKQDKFHYIGHSQGGTVFLVLNSMNAAYHSKIASAHLLAGVGYQNKFPNTELKILAFNTDTVYTSLRLSGNVELYPPGSTGMFGKSDQKDSLSRIFDVDTSSGLVAGASVKQMAHFGQNIRDKLFRRWDHGLIQNLVHYRASNPPSYDLTKINIDVTLHYSLNDTLLSEKDTLNMAIAMPKAKARKVARDSFTHLDYVTAIDSKKLVTDPIIEALKKA